MRAREQSLWVVYRMGLLKGAVGRGAVCLQSEWDLMEASRPGQHTLIRGNITNEGEAERLARGLQNVEPPATLLQSLRA